MSIYFSRSTRGFYESSINGIAIPADAVEITADHRTALMAGESAGKRIAPDENGYPILVDPPPPTTEEIIADYTSALEAHYNAKAQERRYDDRYTCALRAGYPGPFYDECLAFATWMDECNSIGYQVIDEVVAGKRDLSKEELIAMLPTMEWPV